MRTGFCFLFCFYRCLEVICYLKVEAFLEGDGAQYLGGDGARHHVDPLHSGSIGVLLFPAVKHPPAKQSSQLVPGEDAPLTTDAKKQKKTHTFFFFFFWTRLIQKQFLLDLNQTGIVHLHSIFHFKWTVDKAQTCPASQQQLVDQHPDRWPTQPWPPPSQPVQMTASATHTHTRPRLQTKQSMCALRLHVTCVTYQDSLSLFGIWIFDCGKLGIRVLLFLYSIWRTKVKRLKGRLDKGMADSVDRRVHDFHL